MGSPHPYYLQELISKYHFIREEKKNIEFIIKEGIWLRKGSGNQKKLCDLINLYYDKTASLIELKGSWDKIYKAVEQLKSTKGLFGKNEVFENYRIAWAKMVVYNNGKYEFKMIYI